MYRGGERGPGLEWGKETAEAGQALEVRGRGDTQVGDQGWMGGPVME